MEKIRCSWTGEDPVYCEYHDNEWGIPEHNDKKLFEMLILEGFQAGLSWITILKRREGFRKAFAQWDWHKVAAFTPKDVERLLNDESIIRNRLKIEAAIKNARGFIEIIKESGSFDTYIWSFTGNKTVRATHPPRTWKEIPVTTLQSDAMSKDLKKRGFSFVGSTICYAFMQAVGMVDDHMESCFKCSKRR
ncbi:MAG TPA: DNA-3-methyladenine glycosylase I [Chitinispirillaceae bacterium]|nr:DNA-3-methyladenine glycosylase I [Chitinispirillaceae bacterium]